MVRTLRLTRETLIRFESAVVLVLAVHAALLWSRADTGLWVFSIAGFLALLMVLAILGVVRTTSEAMSVVRGSLAVAIAVLVGEATGSLVGVFWAWFMALALVYPITLSISAATGAVLLIAATYGFTVYGGISGFAIEDALLRAGVLGAIGLIGLGMGLMLARLLGDRENAESRVREVQGVLDAAFDTASNGMALLGLDGEIVEANQAMADFLGRSVESLIGTGWGSLIQPQERPRYTAQVNELIEGEIWSFQTESRFVLRDRRVRFGMVGMSMVSDAGGRPRFVFAHVTNITDRVRSEDRVRRSEAHYRNLFELAPVPLLQVDLSAAATMLDVWRGQGVNDVDAHLEDTDEFGSCSSSIDYLDLNEYARRLFRTADHTEFKAATISGGLGAGYGGFVHQILRALWHRETSVEAGVILTDLSGGTHEGLARLAIPEVEGRPEYGRALLAFTDLTEVLRSRSELERVEGRLRAVMGAAPIVLFAVDRNGVFTVSEGQGLAALGLASGEAVGRSAFEMYRDSPIVIDAIRRALGGESSTSAVTIGDVVFETRYSPVWDGGQVAGVIGVAVDITERTRANAQLEEMVKAKDQFMATVGHELRTPLTAVVGFARQLRAKLSDLAPEEIGAFVEMIDDQAAEVGDLIEDLLVLSRSDLDEVTVTAEPIDLWQQIDSVLASRKTDVAVLAERDGSEAKVIGDAMRVRQIVRNLLTNAERYGGEHVTVRVVKGDEITSMFVIDDGDGVPEGEQANIFEPYQQAGTSGGAYDSVGLGLTVSRNLARLMNGDLTYVYYRDHSFFELRLPTA